MPRNEAKEPEEVVMIFKRFIMVNTVLLLLFLLVSSDLVSKETTQKNDFRDSKWGIKKDKVLSTEKNKPKVAGPNNQYFTVVYTGKIANIKTEYSYEFLDNVLVMGTYALLEKHSNMNKYINDYNKLKEIMIRKYGSPIKSDLRWYNDMFKNRPQDYGIAVSMGHLVFASNWETDRTLILLFLSGDNFKFTTGVLYTSKLYKELIDKANEKVDEEGL